MTTELLLGRDVESHSEIPTDIWACRLNEDGSETGYVNRRCGRPVGEIAEDLTKAYADDDEYRFDYEYLTLDHKWLYDGGTSKDECPEVIGFACYATTGGSEGHLVHIDILVKDPNGGRPALQGLVFIKTFQGMEVAQRMANKAAVLLGA